MFYTISFPVKPWEIKEIHFKRHACAGCGTYLEDRLGGVAVIITSRSQIVPVTSTFDRIALSEYAIELFQREGITGWEPFSEKVKIHRRGLSRSVKIPTYHEINVTGRAGQVKDYPGVELKSVCKVCGHKVWSQPREGFQVREDLWDGSDIFEIDRFMDFIVSQKFADMVRAHKIRGIRLEPTEEWRDPFPES
jgi:hypothetical protein